MSDYIVKDTELTSVANAIRTKGGTNSQLVFPGGFVSAIGNISGGGGSSDFSTAEVTLISTEEFIEVSIPVIINDGTSTFDSPDVGTYTVPLYKNKAILNVLNLYSISISGDAVYNDDEIPVIIVSGDCSITFTLMNSDY